MCLNPSFDLQFHMYQPRVKETSLLAPLTRQNFEATKQNLHVEHYPECSGLFSSLNIVSAYLFLKQEHALLLG